MKAVNKNTVPESHKNPLVEANSNRTEDVTSEELLQLESFKNLSPLQAEELIATIKVFTAIVFEANQLSEKKQAPVVELFTPTLKEKAA